MVMPVIWVIFSYLLGSFPSGYLIGRFSGKNVLKIGWRKTSGSNVLKNVGKWQGILTGVLDIGKGYLAVYGAKKLGLSSEIQVFAGVAAIVGHNWSIFLKMAGGRGIGTFAGALLAISPLILIWTIIPLIVLGLVWNLAIGTILMLITAILLSRYFGQFATAGTFVLLVLIPIFIKRLSPIKEIGQAKNKAVLIRNRLLFDRDEAMLELRIKKIFWRSTKASWQAAKFGAKMAKKPLDFIMGNHEKVILALEVEDFKKMMMAASKKIVLHQEEINKINVFPVADKDTGYNLAATLLGVEGLISQKNYADFRELTNDIKEAAMVNARGNAGMIFTGYMIEVLDRIKHLKTIDAFHLGLAMQRGIKAARTSVATPIEGTILDVIKTAGQTTFTMAKKEKNIIKILEEAKAASEVALKETKEKLAVLKENDVVDAGALGFVKVLEAWLESLKGVSIEAKFEVTAPILPPQPEESLAYRYEVVLSFKKEANTQIETLKAELLLLGDSLEILELKDAVKIHIHTNQPDIIREKFKNYSKLEIRVENMIKEIKKLEKKPLGLVVDEIADLPKDLLEKYDIMEVPFTTKFPDGEIITSKEEIFAKMREAIKKGRPLPATSAPPFQEYLKAFEKALARFEKILVITVSAKLSGAYSSARIARSIFKKPEKLNIYIFDCFTAEAAEGLVVLRTQELISQGKNREEVVEELKKLCPKLTLLATLDDFKYIVRGGRIRLPKILLPLFSLARTIKIRPLISLRNGQIKLAKIKFGRNIGELLAQEINSIRQGQKIRLAIAHADNAKEAKRLEEILSKFPGIEIVFTSAVSPVVGTHTGPGALLVAFYAIDD